MERIRIARAMNTCIMYHVCNSIGSSSVYDVGRRVVRVEDKVRGSVE